MNRFLLQNAIRFLGFFIVFLLFLGVFTHCQSTYVSGVNPDFSLPPQTLVFFQKKSEKKSQTPSTSQSVLWIFLEIYPSGEVNEEHFYYHSNPTSSEFLSRTTKRSGRVVSSDKKSTRIIYQSVVHENRSGKTPESALPFLPTANPPVPLPIQELQTFQWDFEKAYLTEERIVTNTGNELVWVYKQPELGLGRFSTEFTHKKGSTKLTTRHYDPALTEYQVLEFDPRKSRSILVLEMNPQNLYRWFPSNPPPAGTKLDIEIGSQTLDKKSLYSNYFFSKGNEETP